MRKYFLVSATVILTIVLLSCCANMQNSQMKSQSDASEASQASNQKSVDTSRFIGEEKAKSIALQKAGITSEGVIFDRVEFDGDDGVWRYEVEFRKGRTEYDADIKAIDGTIMSWDIDYAD